MKETTEVAEKKLLCVLETMKRISGVVRQPSFDGELRTVEPFTCGIRRAYLRRLIAETADWSQSSV